MGTSNKEILVLIAALPLFLLLTVITQPDAKFQTFDRWVQQEKSAPTTTNHHTPRLKP
jgi:hypothetical protein